MTLAIATLMVIGFLIGFTSHYVLHLAIEEWKEAEAHEYFEDKESRSTLQR